MKEAPMTCLGKSADEGAGQRVTLLQVSSAYNEEGVLIRSKPADLAQRINAESTSGRMSVTDNGTLFRNPHEGSTGKMVVRQLCR
jgi:hypothetical protein